jgi:HKD family nuclease
VIIPSGPEIPEDYQRIIDTEVDDLDQNCSIRVVCPYVTSAGLSSLWGEGGSSWQSGRTSEWIIGLNQGITEPEALRELLEFGDELNPRVFLPEESVSTHALHNDPQIHAKGYILTDSNDGAIISGSANITESAIGDDPSNYELGSVSRELSKEDKENLSEWWGKMRSQTTELTTDLIEKYSDIIEGGQFSSSTEPTGQVRQPTPIETSRHLWIYTSDLSSGSRHQLDMKRGLAAFFSDEEDDYSISLVIDGEPYPGNEIVYRPDKHTVPQWRLHLPTTSDGFSPHEEDTRFWCNKYIQFEELVEGENRYRLHTESSENDRVEGWRAKAQEFGVNSKTGTVGGRGQRREYGFY